MCLWLPGDKGQRVAGLCYPGGSYCRWPRLRFRLPWRWVHYINFVWYGSFDLFSAWHTAKMVHVVFLCSADTNWLHFPLSSACCCSCLHGACYLACMCIFYAWLVGITNRTSQNSANTPPDVHSVQGRWMMLCRSCDNQMAGSQCEHSVWVPGCCAL